MPTPPGYLSDLLSKGNLVFPFTLPVSSLGSRRTFRSILLIKPELLFANSAWFGWLSNWSLPHPWPQVMWWEKNAPFLTHTLHKTRSALRPVNCPFKIIALEAQGLFQFWVTLPKTSHVSDTLLEQRLPLLQGIPSVGEVLLKGTSHTPLFMSWSLGNGHSVLHFGFWRGLEKWVALGWSKIHKLLGGILSKSFQIGTSWHHMSWMPDFSVHWGLTTICSWWSVNMATWGNFLIYG